MPALTKNRSRIRRFEDEVRRIFSTDQETRQKPAWEDAEIRRQRKRAEGMKRSKQQAEVSPNMINKHPKQDYDSESRFNLEDPVISDAQYH